MKSLFKSILVMSALIIIGASCSDESLDVTPESQQAIVEENESADNARKLKYDYLTVTNFSESSNTLNWKIAPGTYTKAIYRGTSPEALNFKLTINADLYHEDLITSGAYNNWIASSYVDEENISPSTTYYYRVQYQNTKTGKITYSEIEKVTTPASSADYLQLSAPSTTVNVSWLTSPDSYTKGIFRSTSENGEYAQVTINPDFYYEDQITEGTFDGWTNSGYVDDQGIQAATTYYYKILYQKKNSTETYYSETEVITTQN